MPFSKVMLLFIFVLPLAFSPGPNNMLCATLGSKYGVKSTLPFIIGMNTTVVLATFIIGYCFGSIIESSPVLFVYLKYIGASVLILVAIKLFVSTTAAGKRTKSYIPGYVEGILLNALNPKAITVLVIMYTQFYDPHTPPTRQIIIITSLMLIVSVGAHFLWTIGGRFLQLKLSEKKLIRVQRILISIVVLLIPIMLFVI